MSAPKSAPARRRFLALLTGAAAAPVAAALPAIAATTAPAITEAPELLALGERLPALLDAYRTAMAAQYEAEATYERLRPALPADLIEVHGDRSMALADLEVDATGEATFRGEGGSRRKIYIWKRLMMHIINQEIGPRTKEGRRLNRLARTAKKYEAGTKAAYLVSGFDLCERQTCAVAVEIDGLAGKLLTLKASTLEGVLVYARASLAVAECLGDDIRQMGLSAKLGDRIAEALLRIAGKGGAS